jgi:hypothetical protein
VIRNTVYRIPNDCCKLLKTNEIIITKINELIPAVIISVIMNEIIENPAIFKISKNTCFEFSNLVKPLKSNFKYSIKVLNEPILVLVIRNVSGIIRSWDNKKIMKINHHRLAINPKNFTIPLLYPRKVKSYSLKKGYKPPDRPKTNNKK